MNNIYLNTSDNQALDFATFEESMIEICKEQRLNGKALAFAFILYDLTNPEIKKLLDDADYWNSLNEISGDKICVFSIHTDNENVQSSNAATLDHQKSLSISRHKKRKCNRVAKERCRMVAVTGRAIKISYANRNVVHSEQSIIAKYFNITPPYPSILFYQVDNEKVISAFYVKLEKRHVEDAYLEIENYIKIAADSINQVKAEYKHNFEEIYRLIYSEVNPTRNRLIIWSILNPIFSLLK